MQARRNHSPFARRAAALAVLGVVATGSAAAVGAAHAVGETADLSVTQAVIGTPRVGTASLLAVTIVNDGPDAVTEAIVPGGVPVGSTLNAVTPSQGLCAKGRNSVYTCNTGVLAAGASARLTVSFTPTSISPATAQASVSGSGATDPDPSDNVSRLVVEAAPGPVDVQLGGSTSTNGPDAGTAFDYRFGVKVSGKDAAPDVVVDVALPASVTPVAFPGSCTLTGTLLHCELGMLPGGGQAAVVVSVVAPTTVDEVLTATGTVSSGAPDPKPANTTDVLDPTTR